MITITLIDHGRGGRFRVGGDAIDLRLMRGRLLANGRTAAQLNPMIAGDVLIDDTERRNIHAFMAGVNTVTIHDPEEVAVTVARAINGLARIERVDNDILTMGEKTRIAQAIRDMTTIKTRVEQSMIESVASGATEARS